MDPQRKKFYWQVYAVEFAVLLAWVGWFAWRIVARRSAIEEWGPAAIGILLLTAGWGGVWIALAVRAWNRGLCELAPSRWLDAGTERTSARRVAIGVVVGMVLLVGISLPPIFSDDLHRYLFEGTVVAHGINPYVIPPISEELYAIDSTIPRIWGEINNKEMTAIYPPLNELLFGLMARMGLGGAGFKLVFLGVGFGALVVTRRWMTAEGIPTGRVLLMGLLPLTIIEVLISGHVDVLVMLGSAMMFAAVSSLRGVEGGRDDWRGVGVAAVGMVLCVQTKLLPILLLPHLAMQFRSWRERTGVVLGVLLLSVLPYVAFLDAGPRLFASFTTYAKVWEHNGFAHPILLHQLRVFDPGGTMSMEGINGLGRLLGKEDFAARALAAEGFERQHPHQFASRAVCAVLFLVLYIYTLCRRSMRLDRQWLLLVGGGLLLSPVVHPWYLLALLPAAMRGGTAGKLALWWILTVPITYVTLPEWWRGGVWKQAEWTWWLQYGGLIGIAAWNWWKRRG